MLHVFEIKRLWVYVGILAPQSRIFHAIVEKE